MGEEDHQGGIYTGRTPGRARDHLFLAEETDCHRGDDRRVMSVGEQVMEGEYDGLDLGVIRCDRVGRGRGLSHVLARDRGRILRIQGIVEVGRGRAAEEGGLSAISEIAGRGRHDFFVFFWLTALTSFGIYGKYLSQMHLLRKSDVHIKSQREV